MLHHGKHAPVPTILRPVAGIKFEISLFCVHFELYDDSSRMNLEGYKTILATSFQENATQTHQKALHIASGQWPKTPCQFSQGVYQGKEIEGLRLPKSISRFKPDWTWISSAKEETKGRNSPKQATVELATLKAGKAFQG